MQWCRSAKFTKIRILLDFFPIKPAEKNCVTSAIEQLPHNPTSKHSEEINYFEEVFLLKQRRKLASSIVT